MNSSLKHFFYLPSWKVILEAKVKVVKQNKDINDISNFILIVRFILIY